MNAMQTVEKHAEIAHVTEHVTECAEKHVTESADDGDREAACVRSALMRVRLLIGPMPKLTIGLLESGEPTRAPRCKVTALVDTGANVSLVIM